MKIRTALGLMGVIAGSLLGATGVQAGMFSYVSDSEQATAVSARVYEGYARDRASDGTYAPETFVYGNGGEVASQPVAISTSFYLNGGSQFGSYIADPTIDSLSFKDVAQRINGALEAENYVPARDPAKTKLMIMVYWGRSTGTVDFHGDGGFRDAMDAQNAMLMGFDSDPAIRAVFDPTVQFWGRSFRANFLIQNDAKVMSALEVDRYYVILRAYDFQTAWKQKKLKLVWETRFSLAERTRDFGAELPYMAFSAARYFGQETGGLMLDPLPDGQVDVGEVRNEGSVPMRP
jgi:hypothetical protein